MHEPQFAAEYRYQAETYRPHPEDDRIARIVEESQEMERVAVIAERVLRVVRDLEPLSEVYEGSYGKCCAQYHDDVQAVAEAVV